MWDILLYLPSELALGLRRGKDYFLFTFPWKEPYAYEAWNVEKPEAINVPKDELFMALLVRARVDAFARVTRMAKANLNGQVPKSLNDMHVNGLKFAFKRFQQKRGSASDFLEDLRCCALVAPIPDSFWPALEQHVNRERMEKLRRSMQILERFHVTPEQWLERAVQYMSRCLWAQDAFEIIALAGSQLAICYPNSPMKPLLVELSQRAQGLLKAREIEQTMGSMKPWQRNGPTIKKAIRVGPRSTPAKREKKSEDDEKGGK